MGEGDPLLAIAGKKEEEQAYAEGLGLALWPDLLKCPPRGECAKKADDKIEDLPDKGDGGQDTGGENEDRPKKGAKGTKGRDKFCGSKKLADPCKGPIVPVKAEPGDKQPIRENGK